MDITKPKSTVKETSTPQKSAYPAPRAHRPRSTTESGPRRQISVDYPGRDSDKSVQLQSLKPLGSPEGHHQKKLPTIIKYAGQGKDVYVCGKLK